MRALQLTIRRAARADDPTTDDLRALADQHGAGLATVEHVASSHTSVRFLLTDRADVAAIQSGVAALFHVPVDQLAVVSG